VDQDAAHGLGGGGEEMGAVLKLRVAIFTDEPQPGFVDESGG
jgi:hypothetical protein